MISESGKACSLVFRVKKRLERYTVLEIKIDTGRFHQIRAQLSTYGHIIKGDLKYGAKRSNAEGGIYLHCHTLSLQHPVTEEKFDFEAEFPSMSLWQFV